MASVSYAAAVRSWLVIAVAFAGIPACRDGKLAQLEQIKAEVCACKTVECADAAMKALPPQEGEASHRAQEIAHEMLDCLARISSAPAPSEPAAAPTLRGSSAPASAGTP